LLKITNAYSTFVNGGKKINPILIERIQDRRGKTIYNSENRECIGCDKFSETETLIPYIRDNHKQVISKETSYQILSMLEGTVKRGTGKKLKDLNVPLAGKTGTTNDNFDAWFIGATSNLIVGVYVGFEHSVLEGLMEGLSLELATGFITDVRYVMAENKLSNSGISFKNSMKYALPIEKVDAKLELSYLLTSLTEQNGLYIGLSSRWSLF
jgi:membrane carboxypeptidase/penicillin-binding protein